MVTVENDLDVAQEALGKANATLEEKDKKAAEVRISMIFYGLVDLQDLLD